jgi:hypothetical protein
MRVESCLGDSVVIQLSRGEPTWKPKKEYYSVVRFRGITEVNLVFYPMYNFHITSGLRVEGGRFKASVTTEEPWGSFAFNYAECDEHIENEEGNLT